MGFDTAVFEILKGQAKDVFKALKDAPHIPTKAVSDEHARQVVACSGGTSDIERSV